MKTLTIQLPDTIDLSDKEAQVALAAKLYELGKLTLGQAAEMAGSSKETLIEQLADYGVSFFNYSVDELEQDVEKCPAS